MNIRSTSGKSITRMAVLLICLALPAWAGAVGPGDGKGERRGSPVQVAGSAQLSEEILKRSASFFAAPPFMTAEEVYSEVVKGGDHGFFLVSLQSRAEFARGHVPGAVNIPFDELTEQKTLDLLPRDRKIVLTCDDGHRSMVASLYFTQLGYSATAMPMGLSHWNRAESAAPYTASAGYPAGVEKTEAAPGKGLPPLSSKAANGMELITERTRGVVSSGRNLFMDRSELSREAGKDGGKGVFVVSIQRPEDYDKGHVPGAINIPFKELASKESLGKLPTDRKIVVVCYIGHIGAAATLMLNQLGYEAYDLRFGTLGWNDTTEGLGKMKGFLLSLAEDRKYPVERGSGK
ncbi:rhodanese-like domain-containing protein [Geomonas nitrogeniifigens]|uniref:Rhodanese-like domain-containing protein n=1 Tax=Geomonas diazotrophica TaxID=2843197 RepID=A0ABX8JIT8_9BACT|nr:rhodanese-like domain-containing protein [Geomonas nitrogeniifigens]QWV97192.1 rhodanese-like domain-containing protein [Geomonas nitrogeniifigens]